MQRSALGYNFYVNPFSSHAVCSCYVCSCYIPRLCAHLIPHVTIPIAIFGAEQSSGLNALF